MGLAQAISEAPENLLDDLAGYIKSECGSAADTAAAPTLDPADIVSALKAWAYMNLNAPGVE
ncbi:MAG: hypothetical protein AAGL89_17635 [Pseudomonadota bacterium]